MSKYKNVELVKPSGLELKDRLVSVNRVTKVTKGGYLYHGRIKSLAEGARAAGLKF
jgi:ribosomal protein L18